MITQCSLQLSTLRAKAALFTFLTVLVCVLNSRYLPSFAARKSINYAKSPSSLESVFAPPDRQRKDYHEWNAQTLRELHVCIAENNCGTNQRKVALLAANWFQESIVQNFRGGEGIWAISVYDNMRALGYTTLFSVDFAEALSQYRMMPDLVKVVIRNQAGLCHGDPQCVKSPSNPTGIPAWKIFDFEFYPSHGTHGHASLLKGKWILSADTEVHTEGESPIQYIGYSMEKQCSLQPTIPLAERQHRVWLLMKELTYVYDVRSAWNRSFFAMAAHDLGMNFTGGWNVDQHYQWDPDVDGEMADIEDREHGVVNLGRLNQTEFMRDLSDSKVLIGVGNPWWSPSPYNALCQGVPFLNPILTWHDDDPWNRKGWSSQHPSLSQHDPPYVYNVHIDNYEGFVQAIRAASTTEIRRHILPHMTDAALQTRLIKLMETDWRTQAAALLEERRKEGNNAYTFEL